MAKITESDAHTAEAGVEAHLEGTVHLHSSFGNGHQCDMYMIPCSAIPLRGLDPRATVVV